MELDDDVALQRAERALLDDLFSDRGRDDPHTVLAATSLPGCRYAFVRQALHDRRLGPPRVPPSDDLLFQLLGRFLPRLPPQRHAAVRAAFRGLFTPRRVGAHRRRIQAASGELIDSMLGRQHADLVSDFAHPLPFTVIADVLGVPTAQQARLGEALDVMGRGFAGQRSRGPVELANAAAAEVLALFDELLARRRRQPQDDLLSLLATAGPLDDEAHQDTVANCVFLLLAGHATTTTMLCAGVGLLAEHPAQLSALLSGQHSWELAVEEVLRVVSPITLTGVTALEDVVVDGHPIAAGQQRTVVYAAANRDPAVFADPDRFDVTRTPNPHLAFSAGASFCLGAPLARLHAQVAVPALFTRLPDLRPDGAPTWRGSTPVRQIERMPVRWSSAPEGASRDPRAT